jgi:hypothetical protein
MAVMVSMSGLRRTRWYEYIVRFVFGGMVTVMAGLIAKKFGPEIGGLFLAFPSIFPASATLVEKHEMEKKEEKGLNGTERGIQAASVDAAGASIGTIGLAGFAVTVWLFITQYPPWIVLAAATGMWLTVSVTLWHVRDKWL